MEQEDYLKAYGMCPICLRELKTRKITEEHDDNRSHNQEIIIHYCEIHGDITEIN